MSHFATVIENNWVRRNTAAYSWETEGGEWKGRRELDSVNGQEEEVRVKVSEMSESEGRKGCRNNRLTVYVTCVSVLTSIRPTVSV